MKIQWSPTRCRGKPAAHRVKAKNTRNRATCGSGTFPWVQNLAYPNGSELAELREFIFDVWQDASQRQQRLRACCTNPRGCMYTPAQTNIFISSICLYVLIYPTLYPRTCIYTLFGLYAHRRAYTHIYIRIYKYMSVYIERACINIYIYIYRHTQLGIHIQTYICIYTHMYVDTSYYVCMYVWPKCVAQSPIKISQRRGRGAQKPQAEAQASEGASTEA